MLNDIYVSVLLGKMLLTVLLFWQGVVTIMLQSFTRAFLLEPGADFKCVSNQVACRVRFTIEYESLDKPKPQGVGFLIVDEVKIAYQYYQSFMKTALSHCARMWKVFANLVINKWISKT